MKPILGEDMEQMEIDSSAEESDSLPSKIHDILYREFGRVPTFILINLEQQKTDSGFKRDYDKYPRRTVDQLLVLKQKIEVLGGRLIVRKSEIDVNAGRSIPILFVTNDPKYNEVAFTAWYQEADLRGRRFDVFHENFVHDIFITHRLGDLMDYLVKPSIFDPKAYTGQLLLSGKFKWKDFRLSGLVAHSVSQTSESDKSHTTSPKPRSYAARYLDNKQRTPSKPNPVEVHESDQSTTLDASSEHDVNGLETEDVSFQPNSTSPQPSIVSSFELSHDSDSDRMSASEIGVDNLDDADYSPSSSPSRTSTGDKKRKSASTYFSDQRGVRVSPIPESPPPPRKSHKKQQVHAVLATGPKMPKISPADQLKMLNYIIKNNGFGQLKGKMIYKRMANDNIIPGRTFETLYNHMKRVLLRRHTFNAFALQLDPIARARFEPFLFS